jgi:WD40 repeat protein
VAQFNPERAPLASAQFSPDGELLAIGGSATTIHLWNTVRRSALRTFTGNPGHIQYLFYGPDGKRIIAISGKMLVLWNALTGREIQRFEIHDRRVNTAMMSPDGEHVLMGSGYYEFDEKGKYIVDTMGNYKYIDCEVLLWELRGGRKVQEAKKLERPVSTVSYTPDSKRAACSLWNHVHLMWDVSPDELKRQPPLKELPANTYGQSYSPDGKRFITFSSSHVVYLCDAATGKPLWQWSSQEYISGINFSPDSRYVALGIVQGPAYVLRVEKSPESQ